MIQDIFPKVFNNQFAKKTEPSQNDTVLTFSDSKILVNQNSEHIVNFPLIKDFSENKPSDFIYLFSVDDEKFFLLQNAQKLPENYDFVEVRELRNQWNGEQYKMMAAFTGKHLADWYKDTKFCGRCGNTMFHSDKERAMTCSKCGYTAYPRIMPAVIVGILNKDKIVLTKYNRKGYQNYALVAGFTEIGETAEETVAREVMEETGLKVKNIRYYKSQPWGIANDLLLGYYCEVDGSTKIKMDDNELKFAEWIDRENVVLQPDNFSLTNEMMRMFKEDKINFYKD